MSQIDKLNFFPHLFWFFILFGIFYFIVFSYLLPLIFQSLQTRSIFFNSLLIDSFSFNIFYHFFVHFYNTAIFDKLIRVFLSYLKQFKAVSVLVAAYSNNILLNK